jgi:predicted transposase YdaD
MTDHDRLFKELIRTLFVEFVDLFLPGVTAYLESSSLEFLDKEVFTDIASGESHEADLAVKAKFQGRDSYFLVHVEHQASAEAEFGRRMFRYFARFYERHALPVYPVVVFSYDAPHRAEPTSHAVEFPDFRVLEFNYRVIQLNRLNWRDYVTHENPVAAALMAKMKVAPRERRRVKFECLRLMLTLKLDRARMKLITVFVDTYLQLSEEDQQWVGTEVKKLDPAKGEEVMELMTNSERIGLEKGLRQGMAQGSHQEAAKLVLKLLKRQVSQVEPETEARVAALPVEKLEDLAEALLDFSKPQQLADWLDRHQTRQ